MAASHGGGHTLKWPPVQAAPSSSGGRLLGAGVLGGKSLKDSQRLVYNSGDW